MHDDNRAPSGSRDGGALKLVVRDVMGASACRLVPLGRPWVPRFL